MASVVDFEGKFTKAGAPRTTTKVPWSTYADGKTYQLDRGTDFTTKSVRGVADQGRKYALKNGLDFEYNVVSDDALVIRFSAKAPVAEAPAADPFAAPAAA